MATTKKKAPRVGRVGSERPADELPAFVAMERDARASGEADDPRRTDRVAGLSAESLAQHVLTPHRPQRDAVIEALTGVDAPDEAWEVLAARELIPVDWLSAGARQVTVTGVRCDLCTVDFMGHARECERVNVPATVAAAATLAADPAGVSAAETLARLCFERLYGDTAASEPRVLWRVGASEACSPLGEKRPGAAKARAPKPGLWECFAPFRKAFSARVGTAVPKGYRRWKDGMIIPEYVSDSYASYQATSAFVVMNQPWIQALERDAVNHWSWALSVREKRPNPFTPLCEVWALGYAVELVDDETVLLFAPAL